MRPPKAPQPDEMRPHDLEPFAGAERREISQALREYGPVPDFAAVVARAHELDAERVGEREQRNIRRRQDDSGRLQSLSPAVPELEPFARAVRVETEVALRNSQVQVQVPAQTVVQLPREVPANEIASPAINSHGAKRSWLRGGVWAGVASVAALVALSLVLPERMTADQSSEQREDGLASRHAAVERERRDALARRPTAQRSPRVPELVAERSAPIDTTAPVIIGDDPSADEPAPRTTRKQLRAQLQRAQSLWRSGDPESAAALLQRIVRTGKRWPVVESAYADLFALTPNIQGKSGLPRVWRQYLRRFPSGRFAEDARAGLCTSAGSARNCWSEYLKHHPEGAHRRQAERMLSRE